MMDLEDSFRGGTMDHRRLSWLAAGVFLLASAGHAAEIFLKNGDVIDGKPVPIQALTRAEIERENANNSEYFPILMIHSGIKRHFVPAKQVVNIDQAGGNLNLEDYILDQKLGARRQMFRTLGGVKIDKE